MARAALTVSAIAGCGGGGDSTSMMDESDASTAQVDSAVDTTPAAKFSDIYALIFPATTNARCNFCHSMPASENSNGKLGMGMDTAAAHAALVGKASTSLKCMGKPLVVAGNPDMSLLLQKLGPNPPCGSRMPVGGSALSDTQLQMVRGWIAGGAKND